MKLTYAILFFFFAAGVHQLAAAWLCMRKANRRENPFKR